MFTTHHSKTKNILEIKDSLGLTKAKIHLNKGASLQDLILSNHHIIKSLEPLPYSTTYASSILFPFANRIKNGTYTYDNKSYKFPINVEAENNALHGLVFDKTFTIVSEDLHEDFAEITLQYIETSLSKGFPFTYTITVKYTFLKNAMLLKLSATNTSANTFPFTVGWHPYFFSINLRNSFLLCDSSEKMVLDNKNITIGKEPTNTTQPISLNLPEIDDCWRLNSDKITFKTPGYTLNFSASGSNNFMQVYKPPKANTIAIEPTTGISDSFNNKIGLAFLKPDETYNITWKINID